MEQHPVYAIRIQGGQGARIKKDIEDTIKHSTPLQKLFTAIYPMPYEKFLVNKKGKKEFKERHASYLCIQGDCLNPLLRETINQIEGVYGWVGQGRPHPNQEPIPIKAAEIDKMNQTIAEKNKAFTSPTQFKKGDKIIVKDNSVFKGRTGEILEITKGGKALQINLNLGGATTQTSLNLTLTPDKVELAPPQK